MLRTAIRMMVSVGVTTIFCSCMTITEEPSEARGGRRSMISPPRTAMDSPGLLDGHLVWMEIDPIQCRGNPWQKDRLNDDVVGFFTEKGIAIHEHREISFTELYGELVGVCAACFCPDGHTIYLKVGKKDIDSLTRLGFQNAKVDPTDPSSYRGSR